jgi:hypothetical protein
MTDEERLKAMREGAEIAKRMFVQIVGKFPLRAEVGAKPFSPEYDHFQHCAMTLNALEFEDEDFLERSNDAG